MRRVGWRDWLLADSMANLCLVRTWSWLLGRSVLLPEKTPLDFVAALGNVALLTLFWWGLLRLAQQADRQPLLRVFRLTPFLAALIAADYLRVVFADALNLRALTHALGPTGLMAALIAMPLFSAYLLWRRFRFFVRVTEGLFLVLSPFLFMTVGQSVWHFFPVQVEKTAEAGTQSAPPLAGSGARVVWLLFDEMDQRLAFSERPAGLALPELDRFRQTAFYASHALAPGPNTLESVPGLLTGQAVAEANAEPDDLRVRYQSQSEALAFRRLPNLFSAARQAGYRVAVRGWYFPYCPLLGPYLEECEWESDFGISVPPGAGLPDRMLAQLRAMAPWNPRQRFLAQYLRTLENAQRLAVDRRYDLVYIHWPIPHAPGIYDRREARLRALSLSNLSDWYLDNLALADRSFGEMRQVLEQEGLWASTTLLVTSDHPWRISEQYDGKSDPRVPFLLKLPGQQIPYAYESAFSALLLRDLIPALLRDEVASSEELAQWLDQRREPAKVADNKRVQTPW